MEDKSVLVSNLFEKIKSYLDNGFELYKLKIIDKVSDIFSTVAVKSVLFLFLFIFLMFLNLGIALWLGEVTGKIYFGFFIIAGFYFLIFLIVYVRRKVIKAQLTDFIITKSLN